MPRVDLSPDPASPVCLCTIPRWPSTEHRFVKLLARNVRADKQIGRERAALILEPFAIRLLTGFKLLAIQTWLFFWPLHLSVDYSFNAIPVARSFNHSEPLAGGILIDEVIDPSDQRPTLRFRLLLT